MVVTPSRRNVDRNGMGKLIQTPNREEVKTAGLAISKKMRKKRDKKKKLQARKAKTSFDRAAVGARTIRAAAQKRGKGGRSKTPQK